IAGTGSWHLFLPSTSPRLSSPFSHFFDFPHYHPTFKGSECTCRFFVLMALYTTHSRDPVRHRAADDGVGHHTPARPLDHLPIFGPVLSGQTTPPRLPPLGSLSRLCSPGSADHGRAGTNEPVVG